MILKEGDVNFFRENGFLPARRLLSDAETERLRTRFYEVMDGKSAKQPEAIRNLTGDEENIVIQIVNIWEADDTFYEYLFHPELTTAIAQLMDTDTVRVWHDQIQYKPPHKGGPTLWHQDYPYWPVLEPADLVSAWLALEDADWENGCMCAVPRSHLWGTYNGGTVGINPDNWGPAHDPAFLPAGEKLEVVPCPVKAGEVMFHHCMTWHGTPPNRSERGRPGFAVHYMPGYTRYVPKAGHLVEHHIHVPPGEILTGDHFPTVFENGTPLPPAPR